jgi:dolichyl-diphosphooligosaccharide--protein glycosyltransferase
MTRRRIAPCLLILIVALWVLARLFPAASIVFSDPADPVLLGNDPWYHLHHTRASLANYPSILRWDTGAFYPDGTTSDASGLYNLGMATVAKIVRAEPEDDSLLITIVALSPVVLGMFSLVFLFLLIREIAGLAVALLAASFRVLLPGEELFRTVAGFGDQHAAEVTLTTLILWLMVRYARGTNSETGLPLSRIANGACLALAFWLLLGTWFGALLTTSVVFAGFWVAALAGVENRDQMERIRSFALPFAGLFFLYLVSTSLFPELVMKRNAHAATLLLLALQPCLCFLVPRIFPRIQRRLGKVPGILSMIGIALVSFAVALTLSPSLQKLVSLLFDEKQSLISEQAPVDLRMLFHFYSLTLPLLLAGFRVGIKKRESFGIGFLTAFLLLWCLLWKLTSDFGYVAAALLPGILAIGTAAVFSAAPDSPVRRRFLRGATVLCIAGSILLFLPGEITQRPFLQRDQVSAMLVAKRPWRDATRWLRENTPEPSIRPYHRAAPWKRRKGFRYPPDVYGILSHWQFGNLITVKADRFPVAARFPTGRFIEWFLAIGEENSLLELSQYGDVRYLIMDATSTAEAFPGEILQQGHSLDSFQVLEEADGTDAESIQLLSFGDDFRESIGAQLYLGDGPGLSRYRLIWESPTCSFLRYRALLDREAVELRSTLLDTDELYEKVLPLTEPGAGWIEHDFLCYSGDIQPAVKIFEVVPGAAVRIQGSPGVSGAVDLKLTSSSTGRQLHYLQAFEADGSGMIQFRVPYPTTGDLPPSLFEPEGPYRIRIPGKNPVRFHVTEEDIQTGRLLSPAAGGDTQKQMATPGALPESIR